MVAILTVLAAFAFGRILARRPAAEGVAFGADGHAQGVLHGFAVVFSSAAVHVYNVRPAGLRVRLQLLQDEVLGQRRHGQSRLWRRRLQPEPRLHRAGRTPLLLLLPAASLDMLLGFLLFHKLLVGSALGQAGACGGGVRGAPAPLQRGQAALQQAEDQLRGPDAGLLALGWGGTTAIGGCLQHLLCHAHVREVRLGGLRPRARSLLHCRKHHDAWRVSGVRN
mmetsp:Transcript_31981/g.76233  ORF Transcript_31981/g.76233 Transcript_31981/m.76233 type:complete len:223 (-) Transcript_31981:73-741(-)